MKTIVPDVRLSLHDDVSAIEREWCAFEQLADCTVFQSFGWLSTWQQHVGRRKGIRPAIVIGRDPGGEILFLLPLSVEPRRLARRLTWLGSGASDYNAPLLAPAFPQVLGMGRFLSLWPRILACIQARRELHFDFIHLDRMPEKVGAQQNPFVQLPVTLHPSGAYRAQLGSDWETFYASSRSSATRKRDRRKLKRLAEIGEVRFVTPQADDELATSVETLMAQKSLLLAAKGVRNLFHRPGYTEFYRSLALHPASRYITHVSRLDVGTTSAAIGLGLRFRGSYYLVMSSYEDGELSPLSPGSAHLHEMMRYAIESGCRVFDFTVGDEPYKRDWAEDESALFDHVRPARWHGAFATLPVLGFIRLKRLVKRTPLLWTAFGKIRALLGTRLSSEKHRMSSSSGHQPHGSGQ